MEEKLSDKEIYYHNINNLRKKYMAIGNRTGNEVQMLKGVIIRAFDLLDVSVTLMRDGK